ncbi:related to alpha-amylase [Ramularia collo-cygni]|uniref:alpha-amylase n=1 Tax=Ramularia collo-cygni TaxID=112498 RepID=A0A2D3V7U7_9PEZI|nr:related to alpha-amylase [Ramularia collo-cygni]CZT25496.1 related to alpha-amylase [Ramularia collo-cygni]
MHLLSIFIVLGLAILHTADAAGADSWRSRSIYQVMTDRFALTNGSTTQTCDTGDGLYCGGSWAGLINRLDYIQGMGFDAVWISPITTQLEGNSGDGSSYHGYWQTDITTVNHHFGTQSDLQALAAALHSRDMYLMVDVVTNHYAALAAPANVDYSVMVPFNSQDHYHSYCSIDYNDYQNTSQVEQCWMGSTTVPLPDLRTEDAEVQAVWNSWVSDIISTYSIDGLRIDSLMQVSKNFWAGFQAAANDIYSLGEVYIIDNDFVCGYQDYVPGVFNYMIYQPLVEAFSGTGTIAALADAVSVLKAGSCKDTSVLGTFSENHDQPRFAQRTGDWALAKNVIAFTMLTDGIPIIYQGQEQHYNSVGGVSYPWNREALWFSGYNTNAELYLFIKSMNAIRKNAISDDTTYLTYQNYPVYTDTSTIAMRKGAMLTVLSTLGESGANSTLSVPESGYDDGVQVTELLTCNTLTSATGTLAVPMSNGLPRIYYPTVGLAGSDLCAGNTTAKIKLRNSRLFHFSQGSD